MSQEIQLTVSILGSLGFTIHKGKSIRNPKQETEFLGFVFYSVTMTISITKRKIEAIVLKVKRLLISKSPTIKELAPGIDSVISLFPVILFGKLHCIIEH